MFEVSEVVMVKDAARSGEEDEQESYSGGGHVAEAVVDYQGDSLAAGACG